VNREPLTRNPKPWIVGGVVTSFVKEGRDVLFVRPDAVFNKSEPWTLSPEPYTLNPRPAILTLNPNHEIWNLKS